jgi:hypothetical protein
MRDRRNLDEPPAMTFEIDGKVCGFRGVGVHWGFGVSSYDDRHGDWNSDDWLCWSMTPRGVIGREGDDLYL